MKNYIIYSCLGLFLMFNSITQAQSTFSGWIVNTDGDTLIGATIHWQDSSNIGTVANAEGWFEIARIDTSNGHILEIRHVGYEAVEVEIFPYENHLRLEVPSDLMMEEAVVIEETQRDAFSSTLNPLNVENLSSCELKRAACCSLAESFENNGTVNVGFSDAVTGAREIEMLGLRGIYTQMMVENRPTLNRLGRAYGLEYIPGSWIESIQISKGASTVRNGIQGMTGQINTELIKPQTADPLYLNLYASHFGRFELNANLAHKFNNRTATGLLLHGNYLGTSIDHNHDHFLDVPQKKQLNALWRVVHKAPDLHAEFNVQGILDSRFGGQNEEVFIQHDMPVPNRLYQIQNNTRRVEAFGKIGYLGFDNPYQSVAIIYGGNWHDMDANFGDNNYDARQTQFYANTIFQTPLHPNRKHNLNAGLTYKYSSFRETFTDITLNRIEQQTALFTEYDFRHIINEVKGSEVALIVGIRGERVQTNSYQKIIPAPRLNFKYNFNEDLVIRLSGGRGMRVPNVLIENFRYMATARSFDIQEMILPELSWNYGFNLTHNYKLAGKAGSLSFDAYRTDFENQLITDIDTEENQVLFYNLDGQSFANSVLLGITQDIWDGLELRLAYKFNDVRATYNDTLRWQPFSPRHRGLVALHYTTPNEGWQFNANIQVVGAQRLPTLSQTNASLPDYRINAQSPTYALVHAQVTKYFKNGFEVYLGAENLTNYRQEQPILGSEDPFRENPTSRAFDASSVYAPVMGIMGYAGLRYTLKGAAAPKPMKMDLDFSQKGEVIEIQTSAQCGMCKTNLENGFKDHAAIYAMELNLQNKVLTVRYNAKKISPEQIRTIINNVGYDADDTQANPEAYEALPTCCQKGGHD